MPGKNIVVSAAEAQSLAAVGAGHANIAQFELELGERESRRTQWPKITVITAVHNGAKYLEATIRSVVAQGYPNLEYIVVDDGSTDRTAEIIRKYERAVSCWTRQENQGLYAALNAGFARSTGEVMGWLNSSDVLRVPRWSRGRFLAGANKHIQQESTFWRRSLWDKAGGYLDTDYGAEGDFALWVRFFRHARLHSVNALIGGYRLHEGALSSSNMERYNRNCDEIAGREVESLRGSERAALRAFRWISDAVKPIPKVRGLWQRAAMRNLYWMRGRDWPEMIEYGEGGWELRG